MTDPVEALAAALRESLDANNAFEYDDPVNGVMTGFDGNKDALAESLARDIIDVVPTGDAGLDVVNAARAYRDWVMWPEVSEPEELERWAVLDDALHAYDARLSSSDTER